MTDTPYAFPPGGHPGQTQVMTDRAMFTEAYAVIPKGTMRDIVTSALPFWTGMRMWVLARPLSGFAESFSHYIVELSPGGGSDRPETDGAAQAVLFVVDGTVTLTLDGTPHQIGPGGYAYIPAGSNWTLHNTTSAPTRLHWLRKAYVAVDGLPAPDPFVTHENQATVVPMPGTEGRCPFFGWLRCQKLYGGLASPPSLIILLL